VTGEAVNCVTEGGEEVKRAGRGRAVVIVRGM
jgi:hypothetical protein